MDTVAEIVRGNMSLPESFSVREFTLYLDRLGLLVSDEGSPKLRRVLKDEVGKAWGELFGFNRDRLDLAGRASLRDAC